MTAAAKTPGAQAPSSGLLPLAALVAVLLVSLVWFVHPYYEPVNDGSLYILTARSILEGEGYTYHGVPFIIRPPGFAVLLGGRAFPTCDIGNPTMPCGRQKLRDLFATGMIVRRDRRDISARLRAVEQHNGNASLAALCCQIR